MISLSNIVQKGPKSNVYAQHSVSKNLESWANILKGVQNAQLHNELLCISSINSFILHNFNFSKQKGLSVKESPYYIHVRNYSGMYQKSSVYYMQKYYNNLNEKTNSKQRQPINRKPVGSYSTFN